MEEKTSAEKAVREIRRKTRRRIFDEGEDLTTQLRGPNRGAFQ